MKLIHAQTCKAYGTSDAQPRRDHKNTPHFFRNKLSPHSSLHHMRYYIELLRRAYEFKKLNDRKAAYSYRNKYLLPVYEGKTVIYPQ